MEQLLLAFHFIFLSIYRNRKIQVFLVVYFCSILCAIMKKSICFFFEQLLKVLLCRFLIHLYSYMFTCFYVLKLMSQRRIYSSASSTGYSSPTNSCMTPFSYMWSQSRDYITCNQPHLDRPIMIQ